MRTKQGNRTTSAVETSTTTVTEEQKEAATQGARALNRMRWQHKTPEERRAFMGPVRAARTPEQMGAAQRSDKPRCPCGAMTLARAQARRHKCVALAQPKKKAR